MKKVMLTGLSAIVLGLSSHANAALTDLVDLGCGLMVGDVCQGHLIYDTGTNITWFNYKYTGPCAAYDGATFDQANAWVEGLTAGGVTGWQLPTLASGCTSLSCFPNYACDECKVKSDNNAIGYLFWGTFGGNTGTGLLTTIDTRSGKSYWTGQTAANNPVAFSFSNGTLPSPPQYGSPPPLYYAMAMHIGKIQPQLQTSVAQVQTGLTEFRNLIANEKDAALLEEAIQHLANAQDPALWTLNNNGVYILKHEAGKTAFREAELAVESLNVLIARGYAVQRFVDEIIYVARWLAQDAIDANTADSKPQNIEKGMNEMGKATEAALERYGKAWEAATKTAR